MRWFKHYTNANNSESLMRFRRAVGREGMCRYWDLLEFLASQFDGESCQFKIPREVLRRLFGFRSWNDLRSFADQLSFIRGINLKQSGNDYEIEAPILLELQGRDFKKARTSREGSARKNKNKKKINIYSENALFQSFISLRDKYKKLFPDTDHGPKCERYFFDQIKTVEDADLLSQAMDNYAEYLSRPEIKEWRRPKTSFQTFLGTKTSGYFWRDYIERKPQGLKSTNTIGRAWSV